jgi:cobalt-zinc-cadmium efflux system outer membrane protein
MNTAVLLLAFFFALLVRPASGETREVPYDLTLTTALALALEANPGQRALALEIRKAEGRSRQASARPNPGLSFELENAGGTLPGLSASDATLSVAQILELGGKRAARIGASRADEENVSLDAAAGRLALVADVARRYLEALASDRALSLSNEEVRAAEEAQATTAQRVRAGAAHPVERRRADVELANARLDRTNVETEAALARSRLSLLWGEPEPQFRRLLGDLDTLAPPPLLDSLASRADASPALARWRTEREARRLRLDLERSRRIPDLTAQVGLRSLAETDDRTWVGALSLPLPLFDRNRGAVEEAEASLTQAPVLESQARLEMRRALAEEHARLRRSRDKVESLRREVLPEASRALEEMRVGFERGRFTYLDLLEARRTWIRARREELAALLAGHLAIAELERLVGGPLATSHREGGPER